MPEILCRDSQGNEIRRILADGALLSDALREMGVLLPLDCGGRGTCGKCRVKVDGEDRLACQTRIERDVSVELAQTFVTGIQIEQVEWPQPVRGDAPCLAFDLGTTTAVGLLYPGKDARVYTGGCANPQRAIAADVMGRVGYAAEHADGARTLQVLATGALNRLAQALLAASGVEARHIARIALVGNPAMAHAALGLPVAQLGRSPYTPATHDALHRPAQDLTLSMPVDVYVPPCVSGFVGPDALAASLACGLDQLGGWRLLVDIGTNTEMILSDGEAAYCCAAAAGPALEGAHIAQGMSALAGAIDAVRVDEEGCHCSVIGGGEATGLCGSGVLSAIDALLGAGDLTPEGMLRGNQPYALTDMVSLTPQDVRQVQLAKAAVAAGITLLLRHAGIAMDQLDALCVCGAFGAHIDVMGAMRIGLLPTIAPEKVRAVGNAAGWGALALASGEDARMRVEAFASRCTDTPLNENPDFMDCYVAQMRLAAWRTLTEMEEYD